MSGGKDCTIRLWDIRSGKACLRLFDRDNSSKSSKLSKAVKKNPVAHKSQIVSLKFTQDGLWLVSLGFDGKLMVWNSSTGENKKVKFRSVGFYTDTKNQIQMSISSKTYPDLLYVPSRSYVFVYQLTTGKLVNVLDEHFSSVRGVVYNPTSMNLYSYGKDRNFVIWIPKMLLPSKKTDNDDDNQTFIQEEENVNSLFEDNWSSDED